MSTLRQKKLAKELIENEILDKPKTAGEVLEKVGYSKHLAKQPGRIIESKGVQLAISEMLPDDLLAEKHLLLLNKVEVVTKNNMTTGEVDVIPTGEIDVQAVSKGLDMAYKLKGSYAPDKNININMNVKSIDPTDPVILENLKAIQEKLENE